MGRTPDLRLWTRGAGVLLHVFSDMAHHRLEEPRLPHASPAPLPAPMGGPGPEELPAPSPAETALAKKKRARGPLQEGDKKYRRHAKPPYSFLALIALAIQRSPAKKLRLADIIEEIGRLFAFEENYSGWKESIRHNLSSNACFFQELKDPTNPKSKGNFWRVNVALIPPGALKLQNTPLSRQAGGVLAPDLAPFILGECPYSPLKAPQPSLPSAHGGVEEPPSQPPAFTIEALLQSSPKADPKSPLRHSGRPPGATSPPLPQRPCTDPPRAAASTLPLWPPPPPPPPNPLGCPMPPLVPWGQPPPASLHGSLPSCPFVSTCPLVLPGMPPRHSTLCLPACLPATCCVTPAAAPASFLPLGHPGAPKSLWEVGPPLWAPTSCPWSPSTAYPAMPGWHPS